MLYGSTLGFRFNLARVQLILALSGTVTGPPEPGLQTEAFSCGWCCFKSYFFSFLLWYASSNLTFFFTYMQIWLVTDYQVDSEEEEQVPMDSEESDQQEEKPKGSGIASQQNLTLEKIKVRLSHRFLHPFSSCAYLSSFVSSAVVPTARSSYHLFGLHIGETPMSLLQWNWEHGIETRGESSEGQPLPAARTRCAKV